VEIVDLIDITMVNINRTVTIEKNCWNALCHRFAPEGLNTLTVSHVLPRTENAGERRWPLT
jgi:hypothetical protein